MSIHPESGLLSSYVDGELGAAEVATLETHLAACGECSTMLKALRATVDEIHALPPVEMPQQVGWATRGAVSRARGRGSRLGKILVATTSAAALIAGIGFVATNGSRNASSGGVHAANDMAAERAPQLGASVIVLATNYTAADVRSVFDFAAAKYASRSSAKSMDTQVTSGQSVTGPASVPSPAASYDFGPCERKVLASSSRTARAVLYVVASYEGDRAYIMLFDVPAENPRNRELWVVRPGDCEVLKFEQKRLA